METTKNKKTQFKRWWVIIQEGKRFKNCKQFSQIEKVSSSKEVRYPVKRIIAFVNVSHGTTKSNESIALFELITVKLYIVKATNSTRNVRFVFL